MAKDNLWVSTLPVSTDHQRTDVLNPGAGEEFFLQKQTVSLCAADQQSCSDAWCNEQRVTAQQWEQ